MKSIVLAFAAIISVQPLLAQTVDKSNKSLSKTTSNDHVGKIQTSEVEYYFNNTGQGATDPGQSMNMGFYFPVGSGKSVVYADGFVWSGEIQLPTGGFELRAGGATYVTGLQAGRILTPGSPSIYLGDTVYYPPVADIAAETKYKVYTIYRDWQNLPDSDPLKTQYADDYQNWPKNQGAPVNVDGTPKFMGDFTSFFVSNDMSSGRSNQLYGSKPIGLEIQTTMWGFDRNLGADQVVFMRKKIINKSGLAIKDFYVSIWSDSDIGYAGDDLNGVDTVLKLAFTYNAKQNDAIYGDLPPAQGSVMLSSEPQSAYKHYECGGLNSLADPPLNSYQGTIVLNRNQRGLDGLGNPLQHPDGTETKFLLSGDPINQTGYFDTNAGCDRRYLYSFGPYQFAVDDSIEVTYATLVSQGNSRLNSITELKELAKKVIKIYQNASHLSNYPVNPAKTELVPEINDRKIILNWSANTESIEKYDQAGFVFEGYKIYQYKSPDERVEIGYFDEVNDLTNIQDSVNISGGAVLSIIAQGKNTGISHQIKITKDSIENHSLINGFDYKFGISALFVKKDFQNSTYPRTFEVVVSKIIAVSPMHYNEWGSGYWYSGDSVVVHKSGLFSNVVRVVISDPSAIKESDYQVQFKRDSEGNKWRLFNSNESSYSAWQNMDYKGLIDGFWMEVHDIVPDFIDFQIVSNAAGKLDPPSYGAFAFNDNGFSQIGPYQTDGTANGDRPSTNSQISGQQWGIHTSGTNQSYSSFVVRVTQYSGGSGEFNQGLSSLLPDDYEIRFTGGDQMAVRYNSAERLSVPFQIWNTKGNSDPNDDFRIIPGILDNGDGVYGLVKVDHPISGGDNDPYTDPIYMIEPLDRTSGQAGFNTFEALLASNPDVIVGHDLWANKDSVSNTKPALMRLVFVALNAGSVNSSDWPNIIPENKRLPETGTVFKIVLSKPASNGDFVSFSTQDKSVRRNDDSENPESYVLYSNYPNPFNPSTKIEFHLKFDSFINLTVYDVLGREINILSNEFTQAGRITKSWNGTNQNGTQVASGVYFYKLEVKSDIGTVQFSKSNKMVLIK